MKSTTRTLVVLALVACSFVSASSLKSSMGDKKNLIQSKSEGGSGSGEGQGQIHAYAAGVEAEIDSTNQTISDLACASSYEESESASGTSTSTGHGCEVARRLYKVNGSIDYAQNVETTESGERSGQFEFTG